MYLIILFYRYDSLVGTVGKKFKRKRERNITEEEVKEEQDDIEARTYRLLNKLQEMKTGKIFLKPT